MPALVRAIEVAISAFLIILLLQVILLLFLLLLSWQFLLLFEQQVFDMLPLLL